MASENQGRDNILPDSAAFWDAGDGFTFPLLHNEAAYSGIGDSDPLSFLQLQVSPSPMGNFHGEPANYVFHASSDSFSSMMSNVTQDNKLLMSSVLYPLFPGDVFPAENNDVTSFSALNGRQSYDLNCNVQLHEVPPGIGSNLQLDINRSPVNIGGELGPLGILRHGPDNWVMPGVPQFDSSKLDGSFLSLGHKGSAGSRWESHASAGDCSVSRLSFPPFKLETGHGPFNPIGYEACGSLHSQNLVPSGTIGCLTLSHDDYGTLPDLTSGFHVSTSLPSSGQLSEVKQLMPGANGRSPVIGNDVNSSYTDQGSKAYRTIHTGLFSNSQSGSSESGCSWMSRLPSEAVTTRSRQQSIAQDNQGQSYPVIWRSSVEHGETAYLSTKTGLQGIYQASQERIMQVPTSETFNVLPSAADQAVSVSSGSKLIHDSNVACKISLKRGPSSAISATPRKIMRQHTVGPSCVPAHPQSSVLNMTTVNPSTSPTLTNISQSPFHPYFSSPIQTAPLENTLGNIVPALSPFANNRSSIDALAKTIPAPQQSSISTSTNAYPKSSTFTNITQPPPHPPLVSPVQSAHLQKFSASMLQPFYRPSVISPMQTAKLLNPLQRCTPNFGASSNVSCSATTYLPKAVSQPSIASFPSLQNPLPRAAMGKPLPFFGATGNSYPSSNHTAHGPLAISAQKIPTVPVTSGKALPGPSTKTASTARNRLAVKYSSVVQRFIERQSHALAAFEKKPPVLSPSVSTSSMPHIMWQGLEKPGANGLKCLLCKRDLAYTPEGPVSIPAIPPEVAVLPCGHSFHDHCLLAITPKDQLANPPCIPCSIADA